MKLLAIDTSSQSASCAVAEDDQLLGEFFTNVNLTHSQTILPMLEALLAQTRIALSEIDLFAVTDGPGSFTGLRIGLSAVKGMAHALGRHCIGVSTLEALAYSFYGQDCIVAPVLDARCSQVYTALFRWEGCQLTRLEPDAAIRLDELSERLKNVKKRVFLVGDGAKMCYTECKERADQIALASPARLFTCASSVALAAWQASKDPARILAPAELVPAYLRIPQAERELLARKQHSLEMKQ